MDPAREKAQRAKMEEARIRDRYCSLTSALVQTSVTDRQVNRIQHLLNS